MRKIGIVTIIDDNLGNRLQNFALQEVISKLGYDVETIQRGNYNTVTSRYIKYIIKKILKKADWKFREFDRIIKWSSYSLVNQDKKSELANYYDLFIAGSDQVWNPNFPSSNDDAFLTFAPKEKRISYAASFGISDLPENLINKYETYLKGFKTILVREKQGINIVKQFQDCKAEVVLDPTLLLSKGEWTKVAKTPKIKNKFVLKYLLGEEQEDCDQMINELFGEITIIDIKSMLKGEDGGIGPSEFIGLVMNAELICTDSFHASVFSTIFEKPFVIFERKDNEKNMSSRIDSLCEILSLHEHRYFSKTFDISNVLKPNYDKTNLLLKNEINKSLNLLIDAIEDKGVNI